MGLGPRTAKGPPVKPAALVIENLPKNFLTSSNVGKMGGAAGLVRPQVTVPGDRRYGGLTKFSAGPPDVNDHDGDRQFRDLVQDPVSAHVHAP
jgi:hypothetical protein